MLRFRILATTAIVAAAASIVNDAQAQQRRAAPAAQAQSPQWYLGVGAGRAENNGDPFSSSNLTVAGATSSNLKTTEADTTVRAFAGLKLNPYFAIEGSYWYLGQFGLRREVFAPATGTVDYRFKEDGLGIAALFIWPVIDNFSVFGKLGTVNVRTQTRLTNSFTGSETKETSRIFAWHYGVGMQYDINERLGLRADLDILKRATNSGKLSLNGESFDFRAVTGSVVVKF